METVDSAKAKGNACMSSKDFMGAVEWYTKGIQLDPNNHVLYSNRDEALSDATKCIELNATWPKGYCRKGAALQFLGRFDDAIAVFEDGSMLGMRLME